jgi:hypothetical protein
MPVRACALVFTAIISFGGAGRAFAAGDDGSGVPVRATISFPTSAATVASERARTASARSAGVAVSATALAAPRTAAAAYAAKVRTGTIATPFQANTGEFDPRIAFVSQSSAGITFVMRDGRIVHSLPGPELATKASEPVRDARPRGRGWTLTETLVGASPRPSGGARSMTNVSRFVGKDPTRWRNHVPTFESVRLGEPWRGIRVEVAAGGHGVEKIFTVAPGADPRRIAVRIAGATRLVIAGDGALVAHTRNGPVTFSAPIAWQEVDGFRRQVHVAYVLDGYRYRFKLGSYDRTLPVVIDPLLQATYLGGSAADEAFAMALDAAGNVYIAGTTLSPNFPATAGGAQP